MTSLNFKEVDPKEIFIVKSPEITSSISEPEVLHFKLKLFSKQIMSEPEFKSCDTVQHLHSFLLNKSSEQIAFFLNELCNTAGKQGVRQHIEAFINQKLENESQAKPTDQTGQKVVKTVTTEELTLKLIEENNIVKKKMQLKEILRINAGDFEPLERGSNNLNLTNYDFFIQALNLWVGGLGKRATIGLLCERLQRHSFIKEEEMLLDNYPDNAIVTL